MKKFLDKIFHSDKLIVSCIVRFVFISLWWFRCYVFNMQFYLDSKTELKIIMRPSYETDYLIEITVIFLFPLLVLWFADAVWIQKSIRQIKVHTYEYKEEKLRLVIRYMIELLVPMVPFLVIPPIIYSYMPDTYMGKSVLVIQWLPIIAAGGFASGVVWSVIMVLFMALAFIIFPFYIFPPVFKIFMITYANLKYMVLNKLYIDCAKFADDGIRFSFESNTPYSRKIKKIFKDFNGYYENNYIDGVLNKKIDFYIVPDKTVNASRKIGINITNNSVFAVVECKFARYIKEFDIDVILEEILISLTETFKEIETKYPEFDTKEQTGMLFRCADAFYPKESGLKRL